jgi:phosphatidate cytidylyltransferase
MTRELQKRIISSILLIGILLFCYFVHKYAFLSIVVFACLICWIEWIEIIKKIKLKNKILEKLSSIVSFLYLFIVGALMFSAYSGDKILFLTLLFVCFFSDIGGYVFGKTFGGKKLTKISPNKTISGSIGSFLFSLIPFNLYLIYYLNSSLDLKSVLIPILFSFICQLGDLFISYFKRKAKVKDTSKLIPGHGGLLDRIDGIIFALPFGFLILLIIV